MPTMGYNGFVGVLTVNDGMPTVNDGMPRQVSLPFYIMVDIIQS